MEINREFYAIGGMIDQIFQKLNKGVAIIAIQKAPGETHARGGAFTLEKPGSPYPLIMKNCSSLKQRIGSPGSMILPIK
jgi:hypothetical protein